MKVALSSTLDNNGREPCEYSPVWHMLIVGIIVAFVMMAGAAWGWRKATLNIANPPDWHQYEGGMSRRRHLWHLSRKHKKRRIPLTIGIAIAWGAISFGVLMAVAAVYDPKDWTSYDLNDLPKKKTR